MFKPSFEIDIKFFYNIALSLLFTGVVGLTFEMPSLFYISFISLTFILAFIFLFKNRYSQLKIHSLIKNKGIDFVWYNHSHINSQFKDKKALSDLLESRLLKESWRVQFYDSISKAEWRGTTDNFETPLSFRWTLNINLDKSWTSDDIFCFYIAMMSVMPSITSYQYEFILDDYTCTIKTQVYFIEKPPRNHTEAPEESLMFWRFIQVGLNKLFDDIFQFEVPLFGYGLTKDIELIYPCEFTLSSGGYIRVTKDSSVKVHTFDKHNNKGAIQEYVSDNEFWWVWRNAIESVRNI